MTRFEKVREAVLGITPQMLKEINKKALSCYPQLPEKMKPEQLDAAIKACGYEGTAEDIAAAAIINEFAYIFTENELYASAKGFCKTYEPTEAISLPLRYDEVSEVKVFPDSLDAKLLRVALGKARPTYGLTRVIYADGRDVLTDAGMFCVFAAAAITRIKSVLSDMQ